MEVGMWKQFLVGEACQRTVSLGQTLLHPPRLNTGWQQSGYVMSDHMGGQEWKE